MSLSYTCTTLGRWDGAVTRPKRASFKASRSKTEDLLLTELFRIRASDVTLHLDVQPSDLRLDGTLRASANPGHRVQVSWKDQRGSERVLRCGKYDRAWDNLRAIALTLESTRALERWGCVTAEQVHRSFGALPAGTGSIVAAEFPTVEAAAQWMIQVSGLRMMVRNVIDNADVRQTLKRESAKRCHPDAGGSTELFQKYQAAVRLIEGRAA